MKTVYLGTLSRILGALCLAGCAAFPPSGAAAAEIKGCAWLCGESNRICFWHMAVVTPPKGWVQDEAWTIRHQAAVLFENGDKSAKKPVMYLRTHSGDGSLSLERYISVAHERWLKHLPDSSIVPLADFKRKGQPPFKVFLHLSQTKPLSLPPSLSAPALRIPIKPTFSRPSFPRQT
jgi:hypothetical protein